MASRDLLLTLALRHIKVRYRQTVLGALWAVLQPAAAALAFTLVFRGLVGTVDGVPYLLFAYAGSWAWVVASSTIAEGSRSLVDNASMVTKVYFPRLLLPLSVAGFVLLDFSAGAVFFVLLSLLTGVSFPMTVVLAPLPIVGLMIFSLSLAILLSALVVRYRDFRYVIPFLLQMLMFLSPIIYPIEKLPPWAQPWMLINPVAGWLDAFRAALLGTPWVPVRTLTAALITVVLLVVSLVCFHRVETQIADVV